MSAALVKNGESYVNILGEDVKLCLGNVAVVECAEDVAASAPRVDKYLFRTRAGYVYLAVLIPKVV